VPEPFRSPFVKPSREDLVNRFSYHAPRGDQPSRFNRIRTTILVAAIDIVDLTPCSPEQTRALNALDEAMCLANAAIARGEMSVHEPAGSTAPSGGGRPLTTRSRVMICEGGLRGCDGRILSDKTGIAGVWWVGVDRDPAGRPWRSGPPQMFREYELHVLPEESDEEFEISVNDWLVARAIGQTAASPATPAPVQLTPATPLNSDVAAGDMDLPNACGALTEPAAAVETLASTSPAIEDPAPAPEQAAPAAEGGAA
jgi:hypothetical protein